MLEENLFLLDRGNVSKLKRHHYPRLCDTVEVGQIYAVQYKDSGRPGLR